MALIPKKIFRSFNFMGNRIINAKVNTPTNPEEISNLGTVINHTTYDTIKAVTYKDSFKHTWLKNLNTKTFKQIFDDLFFPRVLPIFENPEIDYNVLIEDSCIISDPLSGKVKNILFSGKEVKAYFLFDIILNDRQTTINVGFIEIEYPNGTKIEKYYEGLPSDLSGEIVFGFTYEPGIKISYIKEFTDSDTKKDSYNEDYLAPGFELTLNNVLDITEFIIDKSIILDVPLISPRRIVEGIPTYNESEVLSSFVKTNQISFNINLEGIFDILIPLSIVNKNSQFKYPIYAVIAKEISPNNYVKINDVLLEYDWLTYYTKNDPNITVEGIEYLKCQFNFGIYDSDINIVLFFGRAYNTSYFI